MQAVVSREIEDCIWHVLHLTTRHLLYSLSSLYPDPDLHIPVPYIQGKALPEEDSPQRSHCHLHREELTRLQPGHHQCYLGAGALAGGHGCASPLMIVSLLADLASVARIHDS